MIELVRDCIEKEVEITYLVLVINQLITVDDRFLFYALLRFEAFPNRPGRNSFNARARQTDRLTD